MSKTLKLGGGVLLSVLLRHDVWLEARDCHPWKACHAIAESGFCAAG